MNIKESCEREHDFALVLTGINELTSEVENALFEAGCDDATLGMRFGVAYLTFSRKAPSMKDAILSAVKQVRCSGIGADVFRIDDCGLVTQSEIARKSGKSRQLVNQYISGTRGPGGFPPPACHVSDRTPLWYWCEVAYWLRQNNMIRDEDLLDAEHIAIISRQLETEYFRKRYPELTEEVIEAMVSGC